MRIQAEFARVQLICDCFVSKNQPDLYYLDYAFDPLISRSVIRLFPDIINLCFVFGCYILLCKLVNVGDRNALPHRCYFIICSHCFSFTKHHLNVNEGDWDPDYAFAMAHTGSSTTWRSTCPLN